MTSPGSTGGPRRCAAPGRAAGVDEPREGRGSDAPRPEAADRAPWPDIEIYLREPREVPLKAAVAAWLAARGDLEPGPEPAQGHRWTWWPGEDPVPVLLVPRAAGTFASLWFDSEATPWADDLACAREAAGALGVEVRCSAGPWRPNGREPGWWRLRPGSAPEPFPWDDGP